LICCICFFFLSPYLINTMFDVDVEGIYLLYNRCIFRGFCLLTPDFLQYTSVIIVLNCVLFFTNDLWILICRLEHKAYWTRTVNTLGAQIALSNIEPGGTYSNHYSWKGWRAFLVSQSSSSSCSWKISRVSCSLILKIKLVPPSFPQSSYVPSSFGLYCSACLDILFVSILCTCCSHFSWYCFISFTMFCASVFPLMHWFFAFLVF
jgi:hypothetical protein